LRIALGSAYYLHLTALRFRKLDPTFAVRQAMLIGHRVPHCRVLCAGAIRAELWKS